MAQSLFMLRVTENYNNNKIEEVSPSVEGCHQHNVCHIHEQHKQLDNLFECKYTKDEIIWEVKVTYQLG